MKLVPVDDCVIVKLKKVEKLSEGGICLTAKTVDDDQMSVTDGILEAVGPFAYYDLKANKKDHPKIGAKVYFKRHSGILNTNEDGEVRRFIHDQDIYCYEDPEDVKEVKNGTE